MGRRATDRDDNWEIDVLENATQFLQVVITSALVGGAMVLKRVRESIE